MVRLWDAINKYNVMAPQAMLAQSQRVGGIPPNVIGSNSSSSGLKNQPKKQVVSSDPDMLPYWVGRALDAPLERDYLYKSS